jgi:hypothetical protein
MKMLHVLLIALIFSGACSTTEPQPIDSSGSSATTPGCGMWVLTPYSGLYFRTCEDATTSWPQYKKAGDTDPSFTAGKTSDICTCSLWETGNSIGVVSKVCVKVHARVASWTQPIYRPEFGPGDVDLHVDTEWICAHWN